MAKQTYTFAVIYLASVFGSVRAEGESLAEAAKAALTDTNFDNFKVDHEGSSPAYIIGGAEGEVDDIFVNCTLEPPAEFGPALARQWIGNVYQSDIGDDDQFRAVCNLARTYAEDGAYFTAADRLEELARGLRATGRERLRLVGMPVPEESVAEVVGRMLSDGVRLGDTVKDWEMPLRNAVVADTPDPRLPTVDQAARELFSEIEFYDDGEAYVCAHRDHVVMALDAAIQVADGKSFDQLDEDLKVAAVGYGLSCEDEKYSFNRPDGTCCDRWHEDAGDAWADAKRDYRNLTTAPEPESAQARAAKDFYFIMKVGDGWTSMKPDGNLVDDGIYPTEIAAWQVCCGHIAANEGEADVQSE